jgi:hypothetical protein
MDQFQHHIYGIPEAVWTIVLSTPLIDSPRLEDPRVGFFRNADRGIRLSVLEQNIVMRLILLDQVIL